MSEELKPCALCGRMPEYVNYDQVCSYLYGGVRLNALCYRFICTHCLHETKPPDWFTNQYRTRTRDHCAILWNDWQDIIGKHMPNHED